MRSIHPFIAALVAMAIIVAGCSPLFAQKPAQLEKVTLQLKWRHQFQFAGYYAAVEKGFYRNAGLDVTIVEASEDREPVSEVLSGRADFGTCNADLVLYRGAGKPVVVLAVIFQHSPNVILARSDSGIKNIHDLAGKKVMIEPHSAELFAYLKNEDISTSSITILPHSFDTNDMVARKVDAMSAYSTDEPFPLEQAGIQYVEFSPLAGGIDFYGDCFFSSEEYIKKHPERVRAFREASLRGWKYAMSHHEEIADLIINKYSKRHVREHLIFEARKMMPLIQPVLIELGNINPGRWRHIASTYMDMKMLDPGFTLDGFIFQYDEKPDLTGFYWGFVIIFTIAVVTAMGAAYIHSLNRDLKHQIAERVATEASLRESEERYRLIFDIMPIPILITRLADGVIIYSNKKASETFGFADQAMNGIHANELYANERDRDAVESRIKRDGFAVDVELELRRREKRTFWALASSALTAFRNESIITTSFVDITERKLAERELRSARDSAESASRSKSEFLANMSHEIRTPMNAILGFTELLREHVRDPKHSDYLSSISAAGKNLLNLINDILDLSKIEAGKLDIQYEPVDIAGICREVGQIFELKVREKGIGFSVEEDGLPRSPLMLDGTRVRQILFNLVGNAIKFTERGSVTVKVKKTGEYSGGAFIDLGISVSDTGIGIPVDRQELVFEAFRQHDGKITRKYGGTGLGLTITKRLCEIMNGEVGVESCEGRGSTFTVTLYNVRVADAVLSLDKVSDAPREKIKFFNSRILMAEDNDSNRKLLKGFLEPYDLIVTEAVNGEEALAMMMGTPPDLVLMDMHMPVMDGYETVKMMKNSEKLRNIPVIAVTASAMKRNDEEVKKLCDGYLHKPVSRDELIGTISKYLSCSREKVADAPAAMETALADEFAALAGDPGRRSSFASEVMAEYAKVSNTTVFGKISGFAILLKTYAGASGMPALAEFAGKLSSAAESFDVGAVKTAMEKFSSLADKYNISKG